jgi:pimeloyl-ACP methyl ester carboxylesterase
MHIIRIAAAAFALTASAGAALALTASDASAQGDLPRRAYLGVVLAPGDGPGVGIARVDPNGSAQRLGIQPGDRLLSVNGNAVTRPQEIGPLIGRVSAGQPVRVEVSRGGRTLTLNGQAAGRPLETYGNAVVQYGSVPFQSGRLRDIYVAPSANHDGPVLWYIQGYPCSSIEEPLYRSFVAAMLARNIAVYRVEKPLVGDSAGTPDCRTIDYDTELAAFEAAMRHLTGVRRINPDRLFMLGHSMGGIQAPMLAARAPVPPRGVAAYGAGLRNWHDYMMTISAFQSFEMMGEDPVQSAATAERVRPAMHDFYFSNRSLEEIAASDPAKGEALRMMGWQGGEVFSGRSYLFWRDLAQLRMAEAWRDTRSQVLAMFGESDTVAYNDDDHRLIAEVANHYRPGTGRYVLVPETDHLMLRVGDRAAFRARNRANPPAPQAPFNERVAEIVADWIDSSMQAAPVRNVASAPAPSAG